MFVSKKHFTVWKAEMKFPFPTFSISLVYLLNNTPSASLFFNFYQIAMYVNMLIFIVCSVYTLCVCMCVCVRVSVCVQDRVEDYI